MTTLLLVPAVSSVPAQTAGQPRVFTRDAIGRAVSSIAADVQTPAGAAAAWSEVRDLPPSTRITISVSGGTSKTYEFVQADDTSLTAIDRDAPGRPTQRIQRNQVTEISRHPGRRSAILGAVIGAGAGAFLAVGTSLSLATRVSASLGGMVLPGP